MRPSPPPPGCRRRRGLSAHRRPWGLNVSWQPRLCAHRCDHGGRASLHTVRWRPGLSGTCRGR
eukprot:10961522-Heterocapsa_arctica.AAC.1